jgi:hypothetical protein
MSAYVRTIYGRDLAREITRDLVMENRRQGTQSQRSQMLELEPPSDRTGRVLSLMRCHMMKELTIERLADVAGFGLSAQTVDGSRRSLPGLSRIERLNNQFTSNASTWRWHYVEFCKQACGADEVGPLSELKTRMNRQACRLARKCCAR